MKQQASASPNTAFSFRLRLFLGASALTVTVLAVVLTMAWREVLEYEVSRLDERLCMEARRVAEQSLRGQGEDPNRLADDIAQKLHLDNVAQLRLRVEPTRAEATPGAAAAGAAHATSFEWPSTPNWQDEAGSTENRARPGRADDPRGRCQLAGSSVAAHDWRIARVQTQQGKAWLAADLDALRADVQAALQRALWGVLPLALGLSALSAWLIAAMTMRPLVRLQEAMRRLSPRDWGQRLSSHGQDREFQALISTYNTMLDRLERSFNQASRFSSDAAHELRTPLTILQGRLEQAIQASDRRAVQVELGSILDEVARLSGITRKLLMLSQADAGKLALHLGELDLSELLQDLLADAQMIAGEGRKIVSHIEPGLRLQADEILLRQALNNLLSNALRYGLPQGRLEIMARQTPNKNGQGWLELIFANDSEPLGAEQRAHFFERFYRADGAHSRRIDGTGLGLGLAREIARAHGGDLQLQALEREDWVALQLTLPA